jgi:hypothetical protein
MRRSGFDLIAPIAGLAAADRSFRRLALTLSRLAFYIAPAALARAPMAELVDASDSKSDSARSAGSIPARGTKSRSIADKTAPPLPSHRARRAAASKRQPRANARWRFGAGFRAGLSLSGIRHGIAVRPRRGQALTFRASSADAHSAAPPAAAAVNSVGAIAIGIGTVAVVAAVWPAAAPRSAMKADAAPARGEHDR